MGGPPLPSMTSDDESVGPTSEIFRGAAVDGVREADNDAIRRPRDDGAVGRRRIEDPRMGSRMVRRGDGHREHSEPEQHEAASEHDAMPFVQRPRPAPTLRPLVGVGDVNVRRKVSRSVAEGSVYERCSSARRTAAFVTGASQCDVLPRWMPAWGSAWLMLRNRGSSKVRRLIELVALVAFRTRAPDGRVAARVNFFDAIYPCADLSSQEPRSRRFATWRVKACSACSRERSAVCRTPSSSRRGSAARTACGASST